MFDFDLDLDLGSRRQPREWAVAVHDIEMPHKPPKRRTQRERKQSKRERRAAAAAGTQQPPVQLTPAQAKYRKEFRDPNVVGLSTEIENGNVEYKYNLTGCATNPNRRHQLTTQMKFRLSEGGGECFYYIGVEDDGYPRGLEPHELSTSINLLQNMAASLSATARLVEYVPGGFGANAALLHIKANAEEDMRATDLRVAVAGSMDAGKSTLVAVLTQGSDGRPLLDNSRGSARMAVFRHKHEIETGRTSSISQQVLGYDQEGRVLNYVGVAVPTPADITAAAQQLVQFIDMGGHEKYLKTTLYGMTCMLPDYVLLCVEAVCGVTRITREHLAVAVALEVPTALVVTKADAVDSKQLQAVLLQLHELMAPVLNSSSDSCCSNGGIGSPADASIAGAGEVGPLGSTTADATGTPIVATEAQAAKLAAILSDLHSCTAAGTAASFQQATFPVFTVSCVTGVGLPLLHAFLSKLRPVCTFERSRGMPSERLNNSAAAGKPVVVDPGQHQQTAATATEDVQLQAANGQVTAQKQQRLAMEGSCQLWLPTGTCLHTTVGSNGNDSGADAAASSEAPAPGVGPGAADAAAVCRQAGHFQVVHTYDVQGVGWVVSGIAVAGTIEVGQSLLWGPTADGGFSPVSVSCIQRSHVPVRHVQPGQTATIALQPVGPDGQPLGSSKEALLSAAAAAQAAAEEQAAKEAAAACAAAPTITFGKPYPSAVGQSSAAAVSAGGGHPAGAGSSAPDQGTSSILGPAGGPGAAVAGGALDDSMLDMLADDLAASLVVDNADNPSTPCGASEFDSFDAMFGDNDSASSPGSSGGSTSSSFSWTMELAECDSSGSVTAGAAAVAATEVHRSVSSSRSHSTASMTQQRAASKSKAIPAPGLPCATAGSSCVAAAPLGCSPTGYRSKGAVLLDAAAAPCTYWEFEALLVLLGGHWPARGLLSGCWPPAEPEDEHTPTCHAAQQGPGTSALPVAGEKGREGGREAAAMGCDGLTNAEQQQCEQEPNGHAHTRPTKRRSKRYDYAYVVHCNSIRQIARIAHMQELRESGDSCSSTTSSSSGSSSTSSHDHAPAVAQQPSQSQVQHTPSSSKHYCGGLSASIQAAAALLHDRQQHLDSPAANGGSSSGGSGIQRREGPQCSSKPGSSSDLGSVVSVRFRFTHRPEWMQVGARLIVRDRSDGHVAAAGFVTQLLEPHMRQQHLRKV